MRDPIDYRVLLSEEFKRRTSQNPSYSQRAFARDIGIAPNRLSEVLSGKQGLSATLAKAIADKLKLSGLEAEFFCELVRLEHGRSSVERDTARRNLNRLRKEARYAALAPEKFHSICEWQHLAILSLADVEGFRPTAEWISEALSISEGEAKQFLSRLVRFGFIQKTKDGEAKIVKKPYFREQSSSPSRAIRAFLESLMKKAISALWNVNLKEQEFVCTFLPIDPMYFPEIQKRIEAFWQEIDRLYANRGASTKLYALGTQFFPVGGQLDLGNRRDPGNSLH